MRNFAKYASWSLCFALDMTIQVEPWRGPIISLSRTCSTLLFTILIHTRITFSPIFTISLYSPSRNRSISLSIEPFD